MYSTFRYEYFGEGIDRRITFNNPEYPKGALWDAMNIVYENDSEEPEKMKGSELLGATHDGGKITGLFEYNEGTRLIKMAVDGKWYEYAGSDWTVSTGGTGFNTGTDVRWTAEMFYGVTTAANLLVACNGVNAPQKYDSTNGVSALGGGAPALGNFPVAFVGSMWLAQGSTLFRSVQNDCEDWTGAGSQNIQVDRGSGDITGLKVFAGNLFIFKRRKTFRIIPGSNLSETSVREVFGNTGCVSHNTITEANYNGRTALFWESENGIVAAVPSSATGGFTTRNVSGSVKAIIDRRYRKTQRTHWACFNQDRAEYYFQYGVASTTPLEGVIANVARDNKPIRWTQHNYNSLTAGCMYRASDEEIQVVGNVSGQVLKMHPVDTNGMGVYNRNGVSYEGRIYTPAYQSSQSGYMKQYGRVYVDAVANGRVSVSIGLGRPWDSGGASGNTKTFQSQESDGWGVGTWGSAVWGGRGIAGQWLRMDSVARGAYVRLLITNSGTGQWFKFVGFSVEAEPTAESVAA